MLLAAVAVWCLGASVALGQAGGGIMRGFTPPGAGGGGGMGSGMMGPGMGGMMGPGGMMGGGAGGGGAQLEEPLHPNNEVECLKFAIQAIQAAMAEYNRIGPEDIEYRAYRTENADIDPETNERWVLKKRLYRTLWELYDRVGQYYRVRDQLMEAAAVYEEACAFFPHPPNLDGVRPLGSGGGGQGGGMGSGSAAGSGGPGMMMGGGPGMGRGAMGPSAGGSGAPGAMGAGGGTSGGGMDEWEHLPPDLRTMCLNEILPEAVFRLGQVYFESHRFQETYEVMYNNVAHPDTWIKPDRNHPPSWGYLTQMELLLGMDHDAPSHTTALTRLAPDSVSAWTNNGIALSRVGRPLDALRAFRRAVSLPAEDVESLAAKVTAHNYMGVQELERDNLEAADAAFRAMIPLIAQWDASIKGEQRYSRYREGQRRMLSATVVAYTNLGLVASKRGLLDDAVEYQNAAVRAAELLVRLEQSDEGATVGDMDRALAVVSSAYRNAAAAYGARGAAGQARAGDATAGARGDYTSSIEYLEQAVAAKPDDPAAWNALGTAYYRARRFYDAETCFQQAVTLNPESVEYRVDLQAIRERLGEAPRDPRRG